MALPYRPGASRLVPDWSFVKLYDPSFEPITGEDGKETMGVVVVALRPLLDVEVDKVEKSKDYLDFLTRHFWGGFEIEGPKGKEIVKEPMPLIVDGKAIPVDEDDVLIMFRTLAMQKAAIGQAPPVHPDGLPITLVEVRDMVDATVRADLFWKGLRSEMTRVWDEGQRGKGLWRTAPTSDAPPAA